MALRVRGETVDEIAGAVAAMRGEDAARRRRRRTRSTSSAPAATSGHLQHLDRRRLRRRPAPACRSPSTATARSPRSRAPPTCWPALGVKIDLPPEQIASAASSEAGIGFMFAPTHHARDAPCRPVARRARHAHDLQPPRPAAQPGRRAPPAHRRVRRAMARADGRDPGRARLRARQGGARRGRRSTRSRRPGPTLRSPLEDGAVRALRDQPGGGRARSAPGPTT